MTHIYAGTQGILLDKYGDQNFRQFCDEQNIVTMLVLFTCTDTVGPILNRVVPHCGFAAVLDGFWYELFGIPGTKLNILPTIPDNKII